MKNVIAKYIVVTALLFLSTQVGPSQGFINLNFESANLSGYSPGNLNVPISAALPGWRVYFITSTATNQTTQVWYDGISLGGFAISINDSNTIVPIQGRFSAYLFGSGNASSMISQTGLVPIGTKSLLMDAQYSFTPFLVSLNGQLITMVPLQTFSNYTLFGGDISGFAGQVAALSITQPPPANNPPSAALLDDIRFSTSSIPEPSSLALFGLGVLLLGFFRRRNCSR